jgi:beta-N-acetylhexosaminidase
MESDWPPSGDDPFDFDTGERPRSRPPEEGDPYDTGGHARSRRRGRDKEPAGDPFDPPELSPETSERRRRGYQPGEPYVDPFLETDEARRRAAESGDPFDTGEYRERRGRRPRHRDLPAHVRRRQDFGVIGLVLLAGAGAYMLFFRGGGGEEAEKPFPLKRLVGQTIVATMGEGGVDAKLLKKVQKGQVGGVLVVNGNVESEVESDARKLQRAARRGNNPPVLIMADQEGGFVKTLPGPPEKGPDEIADEGPETAQSEGQATGEYLKGVGVNVDLAPVLDVAHDNTEETIVSRTYSEDPAEVGELGSAFITGLQSAGIAATAKHFPGLGLAPTNTDFDQVQIVATAEDLQADIEPFAQAVAAGVDMMMVSTALYDFSGANPAAFSANVIQNELRDKLGFKGVVITDDLEAPGAGEEGNPGRAALRAIRAGADLALLAQSGSAPGKALDALVKAVREGRLDRSVVQAAYDRVLALKTKLAAPPETTSTVAAE